jgi:hypothetical protein
MVLEKTRENFVAKKKKRKNFHFWLKVEFYRFINVAE